MYAPGQTEKPAATIEICLEGEELRIVTDVACAIRLPELAYEAQLEAGETVVNIVQVYLERKCEK